ncbi:MAG: hypothetical protein WA804_18920, partial [Terriglobales bacterium]
MSGTMMDNKPLSPSSAEPETPVAADVAGHDSLLRGVFLGPKGIYLGARWLAYLAMAWTVFQVEGWLVVSLQSYLSVLWWRLMIEASMMLAAILPG